MQGPGTGPVALVVFTENARSPVSEPGSGSRQGRHRGAAHSRPGRCQRRRGWVGTGLAVLRATRPNAALTRARKCAPRSRHQPPSVTCSLVVNQPDKRVRIWGWTGYPKGLVKREHAERRAVHHFLLSPLRQRLREHFRSRVRIERIGTPKNAVRTESRRKLKHPPQLTHRRGLGRASSMAQRRGDVHRLARDLDW